MFRYWQGDGCYGIGHESLCRFIRILHNFPVTHLLPSNHKQTQPFLPAVQRSADGSSNSRAATYPTALKSQPVRRVLPVDGLCRRGADSRQPRSQPPTKPRRQAAHASRASLSRASLSRSSLSHKKRTGRHTPTRSQKTESQKSKNQKHSL